MRGSTIRRGGLGAVALGAASAISVLLPGTAQAAEYYESANQTLATGAHCAAAHSSLTVWKKGVQENQIWSSTHSGGILGDKKCAVGTVITQALYLVNDQGAVVQNYGGVSDTVTNNNYTTRVDQNVSYTLPVGWSFHQHSLTCSSSGACSKLHVNVVKRLGPGTESSDWQVLTQVH